MTPHSTLLAVALAVASIVAPAQAAPFIPSDDAQVLERLPSRSTPQFRDLEALRVAAREAPGDLGRATALATAYIRASRVEGDPRFLGYAQAALAPWWADRQAPTGVLVLRATILQSSHQFDLALADLDTVLKRDARNAQATLTRATILTVQGNYAAARADCDRLSGLAAPIYPVVCAAAIDSLTGKSAAAYATLESALRTLPRVDDAGRAWGETLLGEIAQRRDDVAAEKHFRAALATGERDAYALAAYCDWLLERRREAEVAALLQNETRVDTLLLRLALAQQALHRPEAAASIEALRARFDASHARGDTVHARENARFELSLRNDPKSALFYALEDWKVQREPADLRILAAAASAAGDAAALDTVRAWIAQTGIEYPAVAALLDARKAPR